MKRKSVRVLLPLFVLIVALALITAAPVGAAETITGDDVTIDEDYQDDLYLMGSNITINATVDGDVVAFGSTLTVNGTITGDLLFAGNALTLNGTVEDDVRAAGNVLVFESGSQILGDLVTGANIAEMRPGSSVGNDVISAGGQVALADVGGDIKISAGAVRIGGEVGGDADISVAEEGTTMFNPAMFMPADMGIPQTSTIPGGLTFGDNGLVSGNLDYESTAEIDVPSSQVEGDVTFEQTVQETATPQQRVLRLIKRFVGRFVGGFLTLMLAGWLVVKFAPKLAEKPLETLRERWLASVGVGLLAYFAYAMVIMVLVGLLIFTLVLLSRLGLASEITGALMLLGGGTVTVFAFVSRWLSQIVVALLLGRLIYKAAEARELKSTVAALAIGLAILTLILAIPMPGMGLIRMLVSAFGLGAVILAFWPRKTEKDGEPEKPKTGPEADVAPAE